MKDMNATVSCHLLFDSRRNHVGYVGEQVRLLTIIAFYVSFFLCAQHLV